MCPFNAYSVVPMDLSNNLVLNVSYERELSETENEGEATSRELLPVGRKVGRKAIIY
jgi:hypothetical protein